MRELYTRQGGWWVSLSFWARENLGLIWESDADSPPAPSPTRQDGVHGP